MAGVNILCVREERHDWCKHIMCEGERDMTGVNVCVKERQDWCKHMCEGERHDWHKCMCERDMTGVNVCVRERETWPV